MDFIKQFTVTKEAGSAVTIAGEVPFEEVEKHRGAALAALGKNVKLDGFREGRVPESMLVAKIGEGTLLAEMAERTIAAVYPLIVKEHGIEAIGYPQIRVTKLAPKNPLGFTATVAVLPEITLPDYKAIAKKENAEKASTDVTDDDVEAQIKDILRQKAAYERLQRSAAETHTHEDGTVHEGPPHDEDGKPLTDAEELPLPELTNELVQSLGTPGQFENVDDFKAKLKEHLTITKRQDVEAAHRAKLTDAIIEESSFELPKVMVEAELGQMFAQMESDMRRANLTMDDYLQHIKKTKEDLEREWAPSAEKRARLQLVLNEIAKRESIEPDQEMVSREVAHLKEQYKDADEARVRTYVETVLTNEAVMKMLESQ